MAESREVHDIGPLALRASVAPSSLDEERRTVDVVWSTGARVLRGGFTSYLEELSLDPAHVRMGRLESGAPLLAAHNGDSLDAVIGVVEKATLSKKRATATVRFAKAEDDPEADKIFRKVADGLIRNVSVGYRVHKMERVEEKRAKDGDPPIYRAVDWEPYEISLVPMGADAGATVRADTAAEFNPCEFVTRTEENPMSEKIENVEQTRSESRPNLTEADVARIAGDAVKVAFEAERKLRAVEEAKKADAEKPEPGASKSRVEAGEAEREKFLRGASDWILVRSGVAGLVEQAAKKRGEKFSAEPGEFRGMSFADLARHCVEGSGKSTRGMDKQRVIKEALNLRAGGFQTTSDFAIALENVLNKSLLAAYELAPETYSRFCRISSVSDFRPNYRYRIGGFGNLQTVNESGEFETITLGDATRESITATTKGNILRLSRQALANDDLGIFSDVATSLGRAARRTIEADVYALLALNGGTGPSMSDGQVLFHSTHFNIGSQTAIAVASVWADKGVMAVQLDPSGTGYLDLRPSVLLVPVSLEGDAIDINQAPSDPTAAVVNPNKPNKARGMFRDIVGSPYLSGTRRYMFADPAVAPTLEVAFVDGVQVPYLEMAEGFEVDGVEWKVRHDFGVGAIDWRGALTNAG